MLRFIRYNSTKLTYYQVLDIAPNSSIKEIKLQFKKLSKKFHPDLNNHLSVEDQQSNHEKYLQMVTAYDTLKDVKKKKIYDQSLRVGGGVGGVGVNLHSKRDWSNQYYGESKNYSKSGQAYSYMNSKRDYSYMKYDTDNSSHFHGKHKNYGNRFDVPHFDYESHLNKQLQHERRIINKSLSQEQQNKILANLTKSGIKLNQETITKHLLRHVNNFGPQEHYKHHVVNQDVYRSDEDTSGLAKLALLGGGLLGGYLLYKVI